MVQRFAVIMGETDKPLYRPADHIRLRFIVLTSRHILPHSGPHTWPKYEVIGEFWEERRLEGIEVRDLLNNIVRQWKDVQPLDALNLTHRLVSDAEEGEWKIEARVRHHKEVISFNPNIPPSYEMKAFFSFHKGAYRAMSSKWSEVARVGK
ncbi:macroglobulin:complement [Echinococcus multilocularis]|uniref:Macroglobulin:complement n=1 Tax=Echinococcus multilocularis TaxID=6211 RepID=A0A068Y9P0_ECHMU|nr:macroglobulin:complement [Echinococcus multilocularis]